VQTALKVISNTVIIAGLIYMFFGVVGMYKFKNFYPRILTTSKADTVGALTVMIGIIIGHGISYFSGRVLLIIIIIVILNPLMAHIIARAAHLGGHKIVNPEPKSRDKL